MTYTKLEAIMICHKFLITPLLCILLLFIGSECFAQAECEIVEGEFLVRFIPGTSSEVASAIHARNGSQIKKDFKTLGIQSIKVKNDLSLEEAIEIYHKNPNVESVEPNKKCYALDRWPNDPMVNEQWGLFNWTNNYGINAPMAWDLTTGNDNVIVAVLDTGIDYNHPDLRANMWVNTAEYYGTQGVDDDGNGYEDDIYGIDTVTGEGDNDPQDSNGHGTHCAGIIGAVGNNGEGIVGVNWNTKIMALRWLDKFGNGSLDDAIQCFDYVILMKQAGHNIRVTSNSWSWPYSSELLYSAISELLQEDILCVTSAGNDGLNIDHFPSYPQSFDLPNIISVAATDKDNYLAVESGWASNYGPVNVDVAAPGVDILSTIPYGGYDSWGGTSMAAPFVAGLAALIWSRAETYPSSLVKSLILNTGNLGGGWFCELCDQILSGRRINAYNAVREVDPDQDGLTTLYENSIGTNPRNWDTDGDGISDGVEVATGTDPLDLDADDDGIENMEEFAIGTDPFDTDSDGDGIQDGTEMGYTLTMIGSDTDTNIFVPDLDPSTITDPLNVDTDGDGLTDDQEDKNYNGRFDPEYEETDPQLVGGNLLVLDYPIYETKYFHSYNEIIARDNCLIEAGSDVTLEAHDHITLKPGFHAKSGSTFTAKISGSN